MTDQETFVVDIAGRDITFRQPIPGQLIILRRRMLRLREQASQTQDESDQIALGSKLVMDVLDVVESLVVNKEDVEFMEQAMLEGTTTHEQVMSVIGMGPQKEEPTKPSRKRATKAVANRARSKR